MSPRPHDFNPDEEQEIYEIFSTLRREVYDAIQDLATQIFARINVQQGEEERAGQPDLLQVIEHSLLHLIHVIIQLFTGHDDVDPPSRLSDEERDDAAATPIIRRQSRSEQNDE